jgi:hypothetical protein
MFVREIEKPKRSGYSLSRRFKWVDLPEPEGPEMTMGRLACSGRDGCQPMAWIMMRDGGVNGPVDILAVEKLRDRDRVVLERKDRQNMKRSSWTSRLLTCSFGRM